MNTFRINDKLDVTFDLKGIATRSRFSHKKFFGEYDKSDGDYILMDSVGVVYKFKKRDWDKSKTVTNTVVSYDQNEINKLRGKADELARANDALKQELANSAKNSKETIVDRSIIAPPLLITFPINKSTLSKEARVNLGYFAKVVKDKPGVVYTITGYADKGTGTAEINEKLSRERAQVVYDALVNEFGVNADQLKTAYQGGVGNLFYDDPRLSRSVVAFETE